MDSKTPSFYIYANSGGCPDNQLDAASLARYLCANGYVWASSPARADLVIVNGCAYREEKRAQTEAAIDALRRIAKPGARVVVSGCLPNVSPERVLALDGRLTVVPAGQLHRITQLVPPLSARSVDNTPNRIPTQLFAYVGWRRRLLARGLSSIHDRLTRRARRTFDSLFMYDHSPRTFVVRVAEGCLGNCAYCAIRRSRGTLRSKPPESVLAEVTRGLAEDVDEVLLTATDLAAYGQDIGTDLAALLDAILALPASCSLLLFYANPCWLIRLWPRLEPAFASGRIAFLFAPLNACNDAALHRMNRGFSIGEFERLINEIRRVSPDTVLQTQAIVGLPGETEKDFAETKDFFARNYFNNVQVHAFGATPGTRAAEMPDQVPLGVRQRRRRELYRRTLLRKLRYNAQFVVRGGRVSAVQR